MAESAPIAASTSGIFGEPSRSSAADDAAAIQAPMQAVGLFSPEEVSAVTSETRRRPPPTQVFNDGDDDDIFSRPRGGAPSGTHASDRSLREAAGETSDILL